MKKIILCILSAVLCMSAVGCGPAEPKPNPSGSEGKKTLLFQVDEGVGGYEFIAGYGYSKESLDSVLNYVYEGLSPLQEKYHLAVLIYPNHYYKEEGWGKDPADAINRFSDNFLYAMDFFEQKGIYVYLEIMSSGIYTNQNGELARLPIVDINCGTDKGERRVKGISMDLESVKALKKRFPKSFEGLRFHELIGTNDLGLRGDPHAYIIYEEDVRAIIDTVADNNLRLIFSDHAWDAIYSSTTRLYWQDVGNYAATRLGERCTFVWANNSVNAMSVLNLDMMLQVANSFPGTKYGLSNQNWFQTAVMIATNDLTNEYPESDMPLELTMGFTMRAFERGADLVQFEAPYQFFNYFRNIYVSNALGLGSDKFPEYVGDSTAYEHKADFSPRQELYRFVQYLLNPIDDFNRVEDFFDSELSRITENSERNPAKMYTQSTIGTYGNGDKPRYYDKYVNNKQKWLRQDDYRLGDWFMNEDTLQIERFAMTYNNNDSVISARRENGKVVGYVHNIRNSQVLRDESIFADDENGKFLAFATANLIPETVTNCGVDTDEIIVLRDNNGRMHFSMYKVKNNGDYDSSMPNVHKTSLYKIDDARTQSYIVNLFGRANFSSSGFMSMHGVRNRNSVFADKTRPTEGLVMVYRDGADTVVFGKRECFSAYFEQKIEVDGDILAVTTGDVDMDGGLDDELIIEVRKGASTSLRFAKFGKNTFEVLDESIDLGGYSSAKLFFFRKSWYQFAS